MTKQFQRTIENFTCERCGANVIGNGYTNHCPNCFTSKHVDNYPGDRAALCKGLMCVTHVELEQGEWVVTHTCEVCGIKRRNKVQPEDNLTALAHVAASVNELPSTED